MIINKCVKVLTNLFQRSFYSMKYHSGYHQQFRYFEGNIPWVQSGSLYSQLWI